MYFYFAVSEQFSIFAAKKEENMELKEFIDNFVETLELEDASDINAQTDFKSLDDWDSLASLSIISMVDDTLGVTINNKEVRACDTLEDLFNMIMSKT
jgi:acyl carrier protein